MGIDEQHIENTDDIIAEKIVKYYCYFEESSLMNIAKKCAKYMINEYFEDICSENFEMPPYDEIQEWVLEEVKHNFDEKIVEIIENNFPEISEEDIDKHITKLEKMYEKEHEKQFSAATIAAIKEIKSRVKKLQKDLIEIKKKYTT